MLDDLLEAFGKKHKRPKQKAKHRKYAYPYGKPKGKKGWYGHGPGYGAGYGHGPGHGYAPPHGYGYGPRGGSLVEKGVRLLVDKLAERAGFHPGRRSHHDDHDRHYGDGYGRGPWRGYGAPFNTRRRRDWDDD